MSNERTDMKPWSTTAINLPDHANNTIHTDEGARAAGFERALVAGTTVYAYMTHPPMAAWGLEWLRSGGGEVRLRRPVFDADTVDCVIDFDEDANAPVVSATVSGDPRATLEVWRTTTAPAIRAGDPLPPLEVTLTQGHLDYGVRCGDDLDLYAHHDVAPPVIWANLANSVFMQHLVTGPWIHVRSRIHHQGLAHLGSQIRIDSTLVDRFDSRAGERALVDMQISADGQPVATIEHEAIIVLAD